MNTLWSHPAHWTWDLALGDIDGVVWGQLPQETKVCHFTQFILPYYNIPCGKVLYIKLGEELGGGDREGEERGGGRRERRREKGSKGGGGGGKEIRESERKGGGGGGTGGGEE